MSTFRGSGHSEVPVPYAGFGLAWQAKKEPATLSQGVNYIIGVTRTPQGVDDCAEGGCDSAEHDTVFHTE